MNILVTGATGFLGQALAIELHKMGHRVVATGRNNRKGHTLESKGITFEQGDLSDAQRMEELCCGKDWVFHSGALSSVWGSREDFWRCNVQGTRNIVQGSLRQQVRRLIHISSPSIYFRFGDRVDIREDDPLPSKFVNTYTASKYAAEEEVLLGVKEGLECVILRPRAIYGPGDTSIFPRILRSLKSGRLPIIGNGQNKTDLSYVGNVVHACICAAKASIPHSGRAYNITDGEPVALWPLLNHIAEELQLPKPQKKRSARMFRWLARGMEVVHRTAIPDKEPLLTEYGVGLLSCTCTLNIERAKIELGYRPNITTSEGIGLFLSWWKRGTPMKIQLLDAGSCVHPQHVILRNRSLRPMRFHSMFTMMIHPKEGVILFDTGYSEKFLDVTRKFPAKIYTMTTPVQFSREESVVFTLRRLGITPQDVRHIIISHFHADHYGAIGDFPKATYWFHHGAWDSIRHKSRWRAVFSGFLPELIPDDFIDRSMPLHAKDSVPLPTEYAPFQRGIDMFGDEEIILVDLQGHAAGQLGCFVQSEYGTPIFLIADACWTTESYKNHIVPHPITKILFSDYNIYQKTLLDIKHFADNRPDYLIVPSHCPHIHHHHCNKGEL